MTTTKTYRAGILLRKAVRFFDGDRWQTSSESRVPSPESREQSEMFTVSRFGNSVTPIQAHTAHCCAQTDVGTCGVTPAPFLDFQRGGFVCADHKPQRGEG